MSQLFGNPDAVATNGHGTSAADPILDGKSAVDDGEWFAAVARALLPHKAGTALHCITGYDERLCQRYAAGHVKPPAYFLRALLRSEQGWQFLAGAMDGASPQWWRDVRKAMELKRAIDGVE